MPATKTKKVKKGPRVYQPTERADEKERARAKACGLPIPLYRILNVLAKAGRPMTYDDVKNKTTYYANLARYLKSDHEGSLADLRLVKEEVLDIGERDRLAYTISAAGRKLLAKSKAA